MKSPAQILINKTGHPQALYSTLRDQRNPKTADPKVMIRTAARVISSVWGEVKVN